MLIEQNQFECIVDGLTCDGIAVTDSFISLPLVEALRSSINQFDQLNLFHEAGIGQGKNYKFEKNVRRDRVMWIDPQDNVDCLNTVFNQLHSLKQYINSTCFLGIQDIEMHFAIYESGGFYQRHLDQFHGNENRLLTFILYLNIDWIPEHGGELQIYFSEKQTSTIEPLAGRLVCFRSDLIEHEVLLAKHQRLTLTGWFLKQPVALKNII